MTMLSIHASNELDSWKFILEARIERGRPYTCLRNAMEEAPNEQFIVEN